MKQQEQTTYMSKVFDRQGTIQIGVQKDNQTNMQTVRKAENRGKVSNLTQKQFFGILKRHFKVKK